MARLDTRKQDEARLQGVVGSYRTRLEAAPTRESELTELMRDYATLQESYTGLLKKSEESKMALNLERRQIGEQFKVLDGARLPERPISPNRLQIDLIGLAGGFLLGFALVALFEYLDTTMRFDPETRTWTMLEATGPSFRYDAILRTVGGGEPMVLFGGAFGPFGDDFYADVWRFDTTTESWTAVATQGDTPPGRRVGWLRVEPGNASMVVGMGVHGGQPTDILGDLYRLDFATGCWQEVTPADSPPARGFSPFVPAGAGELGLLMGGFDNLEPVNDLWRLRAE